MPRQAQEQQQRLLRESDRLIVEGDRYFDTQAFLDAQPYYSEALALRRVALGEQHEWSYVESMDR